MTTLLAVLVVGAEQGRSSLSTTGASLTAATTELVIGAGHVELWGAMPQPIQELTATVGTKLVFEWLDGHDLIMPSFANYANCDWTSSSDYETLAEDGCGLSGNCDQGATLANLYSTVVTAVGEYYFTCSKDGHCASEQKVKVTVTPQSPLSPPSSPPVPPEAPAGDSNPADSPSPPSEDSAASSLSGGALGMLLVAATTALLGAGFGLGLGV